MSLLCVNTVWGSYQNYVPLYVFSVLHSYPTYHIRFIFYDDIKPKIKKCLNFLKRNGYDNFEIIKRIPVISKNLRCDRFVLDKRYFSGFDYAWIGDIDFLHIKEEPSWLEQEITRANEEGFPYANCVRRPPDNPKRLTGLHFIIVKPYFDIMSKIIDDYIENPNQFKIEAWESSDEELLYYLVKKGIGVKDLGNPARKIFSQLWHGFHIGMCRWNFDLKQELVFKKQIKEQISHPIFEKIVKKLKHPLINITFEKLKDCVSLPQT